MKIGICTDSSCDLTKEQIIKHDITVFPFSVMLGEKEYIDGINITSNDIFEYYNSQKALPKTSAINIIGYQEAFEKMLEKYDAIIYVSLSFSISSTGNNALLASKQFEEGKVYVVDSKSLSSGVGIVVLECANLVEQGLDANVIVSKLNELTSKVQASFVINRLNYLHKGGRCSSIALLGANLLKIKPKIALENGKMGVTKKYMGKYEEVIKKYVDETLKDNKPNLKYAFCTYSSKMPISDEIEKWLLDYGFKEVYQCYASSTISSHCGPETIGILYICE